MTITAVGASGSEGISDELKKSMDKELKRYLSKDISEFISIYEIGVVKDEVCVWLRTSGLEKVVEHLLGGDEEGMLLDKEGRPGHIASPEELPYRELLDTVMVRFAKRVVYGNDIKYDLILDIFQVFENESAASESFERVKKAVRKKPSAKVS